MEKSVPDHHLSCFVMPKGDTQDNFFYPILTLLIDSDILIFSTEYLFYL